MHCFIAYGCGHHRDLHSFPTRRSSDLKELCALLSFGDEWLVLSPGLYFDGSAGAWKHVEFRVAGDTAVWADLDGKVRKKFHRPGLLATLLKGERPIP